MAIDDRSIQQAAKGNRSAQEMLYKALIDRVHRLVLRIVGPDEADDVVQEAFIRILKSMDSYRGDAAFTTWVHRIAVNESLQHLRRRKRNIQTVSLDAINPPVDRESDSQTNDRLEQTEIFEIAYSQLEPEQRALLELREVQQQTYAEIADILDIPLGTVGSRLNKARNDLHHKLNSLSNTTTPSKTPS